MAEREEKIIKKGENKEEKKPSLWQRMKKPLAAGLLGASLLLHPMKRVEAVGFYARDPPFYAANVIEKDKDLKLGWKFLIKAYEYSIRKNNIGDELAKKYLDTAIEIFKKAYEKTGSIDALYLQVYAIYERAGPELSFEETEKICLEAIKIIDERLKEKPDFDFIDLKLMIYYNLADMYYYGAIKDPKYIAWGHADPSKADEYKQKSIEYCNKYNEYLKEVKGLWGEVDKYIFKDLNYTEKDVTLVKEDFMNGFIRREKELESILSKLKE